jgi:hypothetical protein
MWLSTWRLKQEVYKSEASLGFCLNKREKRAGRMAQMVEYLPRKCEAPSSNPSTTKKKKKKKI